MMTRWTCFGTEGGGWIRSRWVRCCWRWSPASVRRWAVSCGSGWCPWSAVQSRGKKASGDDAAAVPSGEAELAALQQAPGDQHKAVALAEVLLARADADDEFRQALESWWQQAEPIRASIGQRHEHDQRRHPARAGAAGPGLQQHHLRRGPGAAACSSRKTRARR